MSKGNRTAMAFAVIVMAAPVFALDLIGYAIRWITHQPMTAVYKLLNYLMRDVFITKDSS